MKKLSFIVMTLSLCCFFLFAGCYPPLDDISAEDALALKTAYLEYYRANHEEKKIQDDYIDQIRLNKYMGTYNGYVACSITELDKMYITVIEEVEIGGVWLGQFDASCSYFYVYDETETDIRKSFISLETAYENGMITKSDLRQIARYLKQ